MSIQLVHKQQNLLTTRQAADFLNVSAAYLARDRWLAKKDSTVPVIPFCQIGRAVRYSRDTLIKTIEQNTTGEIAA